MIYITDIGDSIRVEGEEVSRHYPYVGILTIPKNNILMILDENSEMVVFKSSSNYDTWFTGILGNIYIEGKLVTRENIVDEFNKIAYELPKGTGGGDIDLSDYYTSEETDELLDDKQDTLVSGYNLKTVNGQSLLGSGNIYIEGGGSSEGGCCNEMINNQTTIISMLESLTNDHNTINKMIDAINNETIECEYPDVDLLNDIMNEEIIC